MIMASLHSIAFVTAALTKASSCTPSTFIELNGDDLRRDPLEGRKATLEIILTKAGLGIRFNEYMEGDGETVFRHACKLGFEGIVSKRLGSPYVSGRSQHWIKSKNPAAPAVKREAEEDWGRERWR
jgi:ATP-dependent DNA ligase